MFVFVLGLTVILLTIAFRSIAVAAVAIVLNLLSVGATYGLMVLVFQKGYGADFFGFQQVDAIDAWVPLFLFSVLFGLSMDYQVFLLSRIKERFAVSLLLDATIVRSVLMPAALSVLGDRAWYLPRWLVWLPRFEVEGGVR